MKLKNALKLPSLAVCLFTAGAYAADPEPTNTITGFGSTDASYAGGATINGEASFINTVPAGAKVDLVGVVTPAPGDVDEAGDILVVVQIPGAGFYQYTETGLETLPPANLASLNITPYFTGPLPDSTDIVISDLAGQSGVDLTGKSKIKLVVAYAIDGQIQSYSKPIKISVADTPSDTVCPDGETPDPAVVLGGNQICTLTGTYEEDLHLTANFDYVISGAVRIGNDNAADVALTIDPGVTTYGQSGNDFIWIDRGAKIFANGTPDAPITMTSANDLDATATTRGEWGGLVINGNAVINGCSTPPCESAGEGNSGLYGGTDDSDSSGSMTYLVVKYAGFLINDLDELNGIAFQGVGNGTNVDYVQVHNNQDDGVEFFGGDVNAKHLYLTGNRDDSLDWTQGWRGMVQHVIVVQGADTGDQGFEMDNNGDAPDSMPRAQPTIANATLIGNANTDIGLLIREGTGANFYNFVVTGFADGCIDIDQTETFTAAGSPSDLSGVMTMDYSVVDCETSFIEEDGDPFTVQAWFESGSGNVELETGMTDYINSDAVNALMAVDPDSIDSWFDSAAYRGAVESSADDWTSGWTYND